MGYDVVIVGSGFGGAASAHAMAKAGRRVLLIERGGRPKRDDDDWNQRRILIEQRYRSHSPIVVRRHGARGHIKLYLNEVLGGNSVFYGGASLRLRQTDFAEWPVGYEDFEPYYCQAERLLGVHGQREPHAGEPPRSEEYPFEAAELTGPARRVLEAGRKLGYQPFKIPLAINFRNQARPVCIKCITCDGFPCKIEAKNDVTTTLLSEAQELGVEVMTNVVGSKFEEEAGRITGLECVDAASKRVMRLEADAFILSAGAIQSAALLLRSGFERFSQLLGRGLMRHCNAVVTGLFARRTNPTEVFHKQLCFSDFYEDDRSTSGRATGIIQDIYTPSHDVIRHFAPAGVKRVAGSLTKYMQNLLCIAEDEAQRENRIRMSAEESDEYGLPITMVDHAYSEADYRRRDYLVARARRILKAAGALVTRVYEVDTFSHAVGSVPFGDGGGSVLDSDCRFLGLDNLRVVDGSFMPTSGAVNPSLTITANALRVADRMLASQ